MSASNTGGGSVGMTAAVDQLADPQTEVGSAEEEKGATSSAQLTAASRSAEQEFTEQVQMRAFKVLEECIRSSSTSGSLHGANL